ncbi:hypothetical protein AB3S75_007620 [Citrus x aurantiifolia]
MSSSECHTEVQCGTVLNSLNEETGGMNDILYMFFTITQDLKHLILVHLFDKPCFLGLLAVQADDISGFHAKTQMLVKSLVINFTGKYQQSLWILLMLLILMQLEEHQLDSSGVIKSDYQPL